MHTTTTANVPSSQPAEQPRKIVHRTKGHTRGPITRLMSPGDLGELVKPFVFLDYFEMHNATHGMADHPHSGLATHTTLLEGHFSYRDSTGKSGVLDPGSLEWMRAGGGVWHGGDPRKGDTIRGFQLWVALPPALELSPAESQYIDASKVPSHGGVRVLLGHYGNVHSPVVAPSPMSYIHVQLADAETFTLTPDAAHDVAWLAVNQGTLHVSGAPLRREMAVFEEGNAPIVVRAEGPTEFVFGSAIKHAHPLVCGSYSVHTSPQTLVEGEAGIDRIARSLGPRGLGN
jgi:redox-sensitive bicupin YhaK (pirin superfamily)